MIGNESGNRFCRMIHKTKIKIQNENNNTKPYEWHKGSTVLLTVSVHFL